MRQTQEVLGLSSFVFQLDVAILRFARERRLQLNNVKKNTVDFSIATGINWPEGLTAPANGINTPVAQRIKRSAAEDRLRKRLFCGTIQATVYLKNVAV